MATPGLLQPLPIPERVWQDISMDFVEGLPQSMGKTAVFMVVDRLSKYAHFIPLKHPYTAEGVAHLFLENMYKLHGLPQTIISDRDTIFLIKFWQELFSLQGVALHHSTAYHPQSDGQTEVVNKCLEGYIRCMCGDRPKTWTTWLPLAEWWYNTNFHNYTKSIPYEILYGQCPPLHIPYLPQSSMIEAIDRSLQARESTIRVLKHHLLLAQQRIKTQSDKKRSDRQFSVGDMVYVKLQPYRQMSMRGDDYSKLSPKFFGPFQVLQRVGQVAYHLELPPNAKIHHTFHVSHLKGRVGGRPVVPHLPVSLSANGHILLDPEAVVDRRIVHKHHRPVTQVLIKWFNCSSADNTWMDLQDVHKQFPHFNP